MSTIPVAKCLIVEFLIVAMDCFLGRLFLRCLPAFVQSREEIDDFHGFNADAGNTFEKIDEVGADVVFG